MANLKYTNGICYTEKPDINYQKIDNSFLCIYINDFVKKFRQFNNDEFLITVSNLKKIIKKDNQVLACLFEQLKENNFIIKLEGNDESINNLEISCKNITKNTSFKFNYLIQNLPGIVEISSKTDIPTFGIIIMNIVAHIISKLKILRILND